MTQLLLASDFLPVVELGCPSVLVLYDSSSGVRMLANRRPRNSSSPGMPLNHLA